MHLNQLETFLWVAALRNFHAAARRLNLTQPGISARIAALESELGRRLLSRRGGRVTLTRDGDGFLRYAREVLRLTAVLRSKEASDAGGIATIRVGMVGTVARVLLPSLTERLLEKTPLANIELVIDSTANLQRQLANRDIDVAFLVGVIYEPSIRAIWIANLQLEWLGSAALSTHKTYRAKDLAEQRIVTFEAGTQISQEIEATLKQAKPGSEPQRIGCTSVEAIVELVRLGMGIGTLPAAAVQAEIDRGEIKVLPSTVRLPVFDIFACFPTDSPSNVGASIAEIAQRLCRPLAARCPATSQLRTVKTTRRTRPPSTSKPHSR